MKAQNIWAPVGDSGCEALNHVYLSGTGPEQIQIQMIKGLRSAG